MILIETIAFIAVVGGLPAAALTRSAALALPTMGAVAVASSGVAGIVSTRASIPVLTVWLVLVGGMNIAAVAVLLARRRQAIEVEGRTLRTVALALAPTAVILLGVRPATMGWDPRSIWWFHASWFEAGTATVRDAIADPATAFSHVDYPIGMPVLTGMFWRLTGGENLHRAEALSSVVTLLALSGPTVLLARKWSRAEPRLTPLLAGAVAATAVLGLGQALAAFGYLDVLCAGFIATAGLALFVAPQDQRVLVTAGACLLAAPMVKTEGLMFGAVLLLISLLWNKSTWRQTLGFAAVVLIPSLVWRSVVLGLNPHPSGDVQVGGFLELARLQSERMSRLARAAPRVLAYGVLLAPATAAALVMMGTRGPKDRSDGARGVVGLTLCAWGCLVALVLVYAAGDTELGYWLSSSAERVVTTPILLGLLAVAESVLVARASIRADSERVTGIEPA